MDLVDGGDGGFRVGVRSEQHRSGVGREHPRLGQQVDPRHPRHALVGHDQRQRVGGEGQLLQSGERGLAVGGAEDAEPLAVLAAQVTGDRGQHLGVVVDREDGRLRRPRRSAAGGAVSACLVPHGPPHALHRHRCLTATVRALLPAVNASARFVKLLDQAP
jgi:hypothetical protein